MTVKCSWLWNGSANGGQLTFGFSEQWYSNNSGDSLIDQMRALAIVRVNSMAAGTVLFGYRIGQPNGKSITVRENASIRAPRGNDNPNVPQDAALCQVRGTAAGNPTKKFWLHNLPDDFVSNAKFENPNNMGTLATNWVQGLIDSSFLFRYIILGTPARIASITDTGVVTLSDNLVVAAGTNVKLVRVRDVNGKGVKGIFRIAAAPAPTLTTFTLLGWKGQEVGVSGNMAVVTYGYTSMQVPNPRPGKIASVILRPGTRKCGRPFGQLAGRVSART